MDNIFEDLFIFEMANNHQGSVEHGLKIIDAMGEISRKHGIHAGVKFQYRNLETFIHPDFKDRNDVKHIPRFMSTELTDEEFLTLIDAVKDQEMTSICTPFDEISVQKCVDHGIEIIKVASCSATDWPLLESISKTNRPVIISTGGISVYDIDNIVSFFSHKNSGFSLMHCIGIYPTPNNMLQLSFINKMKRRYPDVPIGYSGHEEPDNLDAVKIAVSKGATILERHVGVMTDSIKLNKYSMTPEQTDKWVSSAISVWQICGTNGTKQINQGEFESMLSLKRGVYASRDIKKGETVKSENVFFAMPCVKGQTTSSEFGQYRATIIASKDIKHNEPIFERRQPDVISSVRSIIHDAKGMIYEANIALGKDYQIDLSHHYGIEHFRQTGALIVNIINREYCKKLVILLSGQQHPNHYHKIKEETFQLLFGDLKVNHDGKIFQMKPGDKVHVLRNAWHSFSSKNGAIFEEISTTHIKSDSYYEDEHISSLDPMERKTIIEQW